jgi:hypothetical protein
MYSFNNVPFPMCEWNNFDVHMQLCD